MDLKGFTRDHRAGIFAAGAAPIQVSYVGYPGTMGAEYIDYLIADAVLIPEERRKDYTEKIVYLPDSYQPNDSRRRVGDRANASGGGSAGGSVCILLLQQALQDKSDGVRCVDADSPPCGRECAVVARRECRCCGESAEGGATAGSRFSLGLCLRGRLRWLSTCARHRMADLFLDTAPYGAHTTASDALWSGVPMVTCAGETFASRVGASLLHAVDLAELVTGTPGRLRSSRLRWRGCGEAAGVAEAACRDTGQCGVVQDGGLHAAA